MTEKKLQNICQNSLKDNKAENILSLDIESISSFADTIIIATANSNRHAKSLADKLVESIKDHQRNVINVEGKVESGWILVDCGSVIVNIMKEEIRDFYDLEGLWGENTLLDNINQ